MRHLLLPWTHDSVKSPILQCPQFELQEALLGGPLEGTASNRTHNTPARIEKLSMLATLAMLSEQADWTEQADCADSLLMLAAEAATACHLPSKKAKVSAATGPPHPVKMHGTWWRLEPRSDGPLPQA